MSKDKTQLLSPLFLKYQSDFEKNPRSRVFAPLAETYRKLGMTNKAMEILSQGIRFHPSYTMGYLGLSFCYFDLKQFGLAYSTIRPLVEVSRDNIRLQKLFAEICIELNYKDEALDTYKYLLFINPRDKDIATKVLNLEQVIEEQYRPNHKPIFIPESQFSSDVEKVKNQLTENHIDFDDWMAVDLSKVQKPLINIDPYEPWKVEKGELNIIKNENIQTDKKTDFNYVELDFNDEDETETDSKRVEDSVVLDLETDETPMVTHTLVDLYCGQGHIEKALELLEKILLLNPNDKKTISKILEISSMMEPYESKEYKPVEHTSSSTGESGKFLVSLSEEDGRKNLMNLFDQQIIHVENTVPETGKNNLSTQHKLNLQITSDKDKKQQIEKKLALFLKKIQKRALDYQANS
jgi:tetratricopeptide (TPR) repeat protein